MEVSVADFDPPQETSASTDSDAASEETTSDGVGRERRIDRDTGLSTDDP